MPVLENSRHERFAQELAKGKTADEAYELAGFKANRGNAATLKAKQSISDRTAEILTGAAKRAEVTIHTISDQLDEDRGLAHQVEQPGAAVSATVAKAKLFKLMTDRTELTGKDGGPIETAVVNDLDLSRRVSAMLEGGMERMKQVADALAKGEHVEPEDVRAYLQAKQIAEALSV